MWIPEYLSMWSLDQTIFRAIHVGMRRDFLDVIMLLITYTGDGHIQIPVLLFLCFNKKTRVAGVAMLSSFLVSGGVRLLVKDVVDRPRPSNFEWATPVSWPGGMPGWFGRTFDVVPYGNSSFPSGHTTTSFAIAVMLAWLVYKTDYAWVGWAACIWAVLVGISRIYIGVHYPGDIMAGAALASITASLLYLYMDKKNLLPWAVAIIEDPTADIEELEEKVEEISEEMEKS